MTDFIQNAFARMDLFQIRAFVLSGMEQTPVSDEPYAVRLKNAVDPINHRIDNLYSTPSEKTEVQNDLATALCAFEEVYMEIGMKLGARLVYQLLVENDKGQKEPILDEGQCTD